VFPFNDVTVTFAAPTTEAQARFDAIAAGPPSFDARLLRRLDAAGCGGAKLNVRLGFAPAPAEDWARPDYRIALARVDVVEPPVAEATLRVELVVTHGTADRGAYSFTALPIAIGRGLEVRDHRQLLLRMNHVAFMEGADDVTQSVSRRHARIELDRASGRPRLIDDNSAQGTSVIRGGRGIAVPRGTRGLVLLSGDEIVLGQARMRVRIARDAAAD
jgi:hypothetical protein